MMPFQPGRRGAHGGRVQRPPDMGPVQPEHRLHDGRVPDEIPVFLSGRAPARVEIRGRRQNAERADIRVQNGVDPAQQFVAGPAKTKVEMRHLSAGEVVIFAAGTGNPFFTTDSAACLRAIEIDADLVLKATKVDGVYTADPFKDPNAEKFERLTYDEVLDRKLGVMDLTAICLVRDHKMPLRVFNMNKPGALLNIVVGGAEGTLIEEDAQ